MEDAKSTDEDDNFVDASDEFPFYDCPETPETSSSSINRDSRNRENLRRRRSHRKTIHRDSRIPEKGTVKLSELDVELDQSTSKPDVVSSENAENSTVTMEELSEGVAREREIDDGQFSLLVYLVELLVKAIAFQFNLLISLITFPFSAIYYGLMLIFNPFYVIGLGRRYMMSKLMQIWKLCCDAVTPFLSEWIKEHKSWLNFVLRFGWGLFWSIYVCTVLVCLLVLAFVIGGVVMKFFIVEEPFQLKQPLNFDYTKIKPEAFVPITSCRTMECGDKYDGGSVGRGVRVVPRNQKLQATVTLVLPESDYNRNLGIFQVRVDFQSEKGKSLASLSHPCMLGFKSEPIRLLLTFFKIVPLVAGYVSESQTVNLKFRGYRESIVPSGCLKVTIEQRAEFRAGAGIPEVYDAFINLESELPFLKRVLWYWRKTLFVWLSMMLFVMELLFALLCCRPLILPRATTNTRDNDTRNHHVQR
ncbi:seipin-2 [Silene latifolia]|uniref:seipin-2 n=1 Tax=Silene latifolia TaxID=37657 RepID=UPI003D779B67